METKSFKSFKKNEKSIGEIQQPCLTPSGQLNIDVKPVYVLTQDLTEQYIDRNSLFILELIRRDCNLVHNAFLSTRSNAFSKSTNIA